MSKRTESAQLTQERLLDLGNGSAIWKVHVDTLREQDVNDRVMSAQRFEQLIENIRHDKRLESLLLCAPKIAPGGNREFVIISGHHRARAARAAGVLELYVLVLEEELTQDEIRAKQLAHNAICGTDDAQLLAEIYNSIEDLTQRVATGLTDMEVVVQAPNVKMHDIAVDYDFELLAVAFLHHQKREFDDVIRLIEDKTHVMAADLACFGQFAEAVRKTGKALDVRNVSSILMEMAKIVKEYLAQLPDKKEVEEGGAKGQQEPKKARAREGGEAAGVEHQA